MLKATESNLKGSEEICRFLVNVNEPKKLCVDYKETLLFIANEVYFDILKNFTLVVNSP